MKRVISFLVLICLLITSVIGPLPARAEGVRLPALGQMVHLSPDYSPVILKGLIVYPQNPFLFDFILDTGHGKTDEASLREESLKMIKYFLAAMTTPEDDIWVNLSPYEKDRIIPESFGLTHMGRDLLAVDYLLKQITASLIYPESELGKKFWDKVYKEAQSKYGTINIPVNTFNKVWIVPDKAKVYEHQGKAFIVNSRLKVMLDEDYLALSKTPLSSKSDAHALSSKVVRDVVIPILEKEINEGKNFVPLRQVYHALILALWFKKRMKESLLGQKYMNQNKINGIDIADKNAKEHIYQQYLQTFKEGVYNYIKEENDPATGRMIPRKYFSGGFGEVKRFSQSPQLNITTMKPPSSEVGTIGQAMIAHAELFTTDQSSAAMITGEDLFNLIPGRKKAQIEREVELKNNAREALIRYLNHLLERQERFDPMDRTGARISTKYRDLWNFKDKDGDDFENEFAVLYSTNFYTKFLDLFRKQGRTSPEDIVLIASQTLKEMGVDIPSVKNPSSWKEILIGSDQKNTLKGPLETKPQRRGRILSDSAEVSSVNGGIDFKKDQVNLEIDGKTSPLPLVNAEQMKNIQINFLSARIRSINTITDLNELLF